MATLDGLVRWLVILLMAATMVVTFLQALARYVINAPMTSFDQLARVAVVWLTFLGAAAAHRRGQNIRIDSLEKLLPAPARRFLETAFDLALAALLVILVFTGYQVTLVASSQDVLGTPFSYGFVCAALVAGSALTLAATLARLLDRLLNPAGRTRTGD